MTALSTIVICLVASALFLTSHAATVKPLFRVGTIGHADAGKTTLTAAITHFLSLRGTTAAKSFTQVLAETQKETVHGVAGIALADVEYETNERRYKHVDCSTTDSSCIKHLITGARPMDAVILVVNMEEGPMPQTKEHLLLARESGIVRLVVFLSKVKV